ncbi:hypothetical protein M9Y10_026393 [Tritrichomonas musculus]|uniref:Protein kinase domain-containing protein n=1 Tax=Tritrichomonas musculus TaxID=1915356 RepID=A0ABR2H7I5_9EUKA
MEKNDFFFNTSDYEEPNKKIGEGAFGKVYLVENQEGKQFAAKIINVQNILSGKEQHLFMRESSILCKLKHPAIVKFYGINFHSFEDPTKLEPTILMEYLSHGSFKEILIKERQGLSDGDWNPTKKYICLLGISDALRYLHEQGVLHRDLKPENILIDDDYYPRVTDFGLSRCFSQALTKSLQLSMTGKIGTPVYMAPELLEDEEHFGFREKDDDDYDIIDDEELPTYKATFSQDQPIYYIFEYCYQNTPGKPKKLCEIHKSKNLNKFYFIEIVNSKTRKIDSIVEEKSPTVIYYTPSVLVPTKCKVSKAPETSSAAKETDNKLTISRCYRPYLFSSDGGVKRFVFANKSQDMKRSNHTLSD